MFCTHEAAELLRSIHFSWIGLQDLNSSLVIQTFCIKQSTIGRILHFHLCMQNLVYWSSSWKFCQFKEFVSSISFQNFKNPWIWKDKSVAGCIWWSVDTVAHLRCTFHRNNFRSLKRCLVGIQKPFQRHYRKYKNRNLHRNCPVTFREFRISILITFLKILVQSLMSTVIVSSYIWSLWKKVIKVNGIQIWCLIIVVTSSEIAQNWTLQKKLQAKKFTL